MINKIMLIVIIMLLPAIAFAATVQVTWNPNTEPDLSGYKLYHGTASGQYGEPVDVGNVTGHVMEITPQHGATYYFALTAYDTSGNESGYSAEATCFIPDGVKPEKPTGLRAIIQAIISWFKGLFGVGGGGVTWDKRSRRQSDRRAIWPNCSYIHPPGLSTNQRLQVSGRTSSRVRDVVQERLRRRHVHHREDPGISKLK